VIDPHLKWQLRSKLKQIHFELKLSLIYVTHDQVEALTFADQVVLMEGGAVMQTGTPQALFEEPEHTFVGYFIGSPGMNLLPCSLESGNTDAVLLGTQTGAPRLPMDAHLLERVRGQGDLTVGIRPEFLGCSNTEEIGTSETRVLPAVIARVDDLGNYKLATAQLGGYTLMAKLSEDAQVQVGPGWLSFPAHQTKLYSSSRLVR